MLHVVGRGWHAYEFDNVLAFGNVLPGEHTLSTVLDGRRGYEGKRGDVEALQHLSHQRFVVGVTHLVQINFAQHQSIHQVRNRNSRKLGGEAD